MGVWTRLSEALAPIWLRSQAPRAWPHPTGPWAAVSGLGRSCSVGEASLADAARAAGITWQRAVTEAWALRAQASSHRAALVPSLRPLSTRASWVSLPWLRSGWAPGVSGLGLPAGTVCSLSLGTVALMLALCVCSFLSQEAAGCPVGLSTSAWSRRQQLRVVGLLAVPGGEPPAIGQD